MNNKLAQSLERRREMRGMKKKGTGNQKRIENENENERKR